MIINFSKIFHKTLPGKFLRGSLKWISFSTILKMFQGFQQGFSLAEGGETKRSYVISSLFGEEIKEKEIGGNEIIAFRNN